MKTLALIVTMLIAVAGWQPVNAQTCAGVTATQEDGSVRCFPPVTPYMEEMGNVINSGTGLAMGYQYDAQLDWTNAVCVGCNAIVFSAPNRADFSLLVYEQATPGGNVSGYQRSRIVGRYDPETNRSVISYVPRETTTVMSINVFTLNDAPVTIDPVFAHIE